MAGRWSERSCDRIARFSDLGDNCGLHVPSLFPGQPASSDSSDTPFPQSMLDANCLDHLSCRNNHGVDQIWELLAALEGVTSAGRGGPRGAGDGNRTRTVSLGTVQDRLVGSVLSRWWML